MRILEKYTGKKTYMFPNGTIATPDIVLVKFPAILQFTHVIETDESGEVMYAVQNLSSMCSMHGISQSLTDQEKITAIQEIINAPAPLPDPTPDERIAAALEYQVMASLPDETV